MLKRSCGRSRPAHGTEQADSRAEGMRRAAAPRRQEKHVCPGQGRAGAQCRGGVTLSVFSLNASEGCQGPSNLSLKGASWPWVVAPSICVHSLFPLAVMGAASTASSLALVPTLCQGQQHPSSPQPQKPWQGLILSLSLFLSGLLASSSCSSTQRLCPDVCMTLPHPQPSRAPACPPHWLCCII